MTNKDKKLWLLKAAELQKNIRVLEQEYRDALDAAQSVTAKLGGTGGGSPNPHKFDRVVEYTGRITEAIGKLCIAKGEIISSIEAVPDPIQQRVLMLRYIRCYSWVKVARVMHYSEREIYYIHGQALSALEPPEHCS